MSIQSEINRLKGVKTDIRNAIIESGVNVPDDTPFVDYAQKIRYISEAQIDPVYYGIKIDKTIDNPETSVEYIGDSTGFTPGYEFWKHVALIQQIRPCVLKDGKVKYYLDRNNFSKMSDGNDVTINDLSEGDVMIEIPRIGYKMESDEKYQYIWITNVPNVEGYCYYAHSLDSDGDCDKIYIGAYLGYEENGKTYSTSGKLPVTDISLTDARTYTESKGTGYQLFSFYPLTLLQCIYTIVYKNLNSQQALGQGYTASSNTMKTATGGTDQKGMCFGESTGTEQIKLFGIEDFWGNCYQYIDGVCTDSAGNILTSYHSFNDSGEGYPFSHPSGSTYLVGYTKEIQGTNFSGFAPKIVGNGAEPLSFYSDYGIILTNRVLQYGGCWNYGYNTYAGIFMEYLNIKPDAHKERTCRIVYKHKSQ